MLVANHVPRQHGAVLHIGWGPRLATDALHLHLCTIRSCSITTVMLHIGIASTTLAPAATF